MAKAPKRPQPAGLPSREQILRFIQDSPGAVGKREIAKHFALRGADKIALKALLKDMTDEGVVDMAPGRAFHKHGGLPKVTVLRVAAVEGDTVWAVPDRWEGSGPAPRLRVMEKGRKSALGVGDRILARTEERGTGHVAHPMKKLQSGGESVIGVLVADTGPGGKPMTWLRPADKRARFDFAVADMGDAAIGDLVRAELSGRGPATKARVIDRIGDPFAPRSLSMIAIAKHDIPHVFGDESRDKSADQQTQDWETIKAAERAAKGVINSRTGTIVISSAVRLAPAAISHGSLVVRIDENPAVVQPEPFSRGQTALEPNSTITARQEENVVSRVGPGASLAEVVDALNALGASPADLVAILEGLKQAGSLTAELVII